MRAYACTEKQKGNSKLRKTAKNQPFLLHVFFFFFFFFVTCNMRVFSISYKHFTHVGMLLSLFKQRKVEWLLSTWSDYVQ